MKNNKLSKKIMRRVYAIYLVRQLANPLALKVYTLAAILVGITSLVSIGNIIANLPTAEGFYALYDFSRYAVLHTELAVQALLFGGVVCMMWLVLDCSRRINSFSFSHHV